MIKGIYSILDVKSGTYGVPMVFVRREEAVRAFTGMVNTEGNMIHTYPEDFTLKRLGDFDDVSGKIDVVDSPEYIQRASDVVKVDLVDSKE